jgi:hypothetical protein
MRGAGIDAFPVSSAIIAISTSTSTAARAVRRRVQVRCAGSALGSFHARIASAAESAKAATGTTTPASARWK